MKAKNKITSIIEILASSLIFIIVIFSAVFGIISMNKNSRDVHAYNLSYDCADQIKKVIYDSLAESNLSEIFAVTSTDSGYIFEGIREYPYKNGSFIGLAFIQEKKAGSFSVILKKSEDGEYYYSHLSIKKPADFRIEDKTEINRIISQEGFSKFACSSYKDLFGKALEKPFSIGYLEGENSRPSFMIRLDDFVFNKANKEIASKLFLYEVKTYD